MSALVENISINVKIVGINTEHNFLIPREMSVSDAVELIVKALREEYPGVANGSPMGHALLLASGGKILNPSCSLKQLGIVQGERMILI